jgi:hypothetical protein
MYLLLGQTLNVTCINNYIYHFLHSLVLHSLSSKNIQVNKLLQYSDTTQQKMSQIIYEFDTICVTTRHDCVHYADLHLEQACPTFWAVRTTLAKFGLHEIHCTEWRMNTCTCNICISGFGGLEVACWPLVPKLAAFAPGRSRRIFRAKNSSARFFSGGRSKVVDPMS